jgi:hypothetical protein
MRRGPIGNPLPGLSLKTLKATFMGTTPYMMVPNTQTKFIRVDAKPRDAA